MAEEKREVMVEKGREKAIIDEMRRTETRPVLLHHISRQIQSKGEIW